MWRVGFVLVTLFAAAVRADTLLDDTGVQSIGLSTEGNYEASVYRTGGGTLDFVFSWTTLAAGPNYQEFVRVGNFDGYEVFGAPSVDPSVIARDGYGALYVPDPNAILLEAGFQFGYSATFRLTTNATEFDSNGTFVMGVAARSSGLLYASFPSFEPVAGGPTGILPLPASFVGGLSIFCLIALARLRKARPSCD